MIKRFWTKFTDDNQLIGFKLVCVTIIMIAGEVIV
jgi:hypothetical protein